MIKLKQLIYQWISKRYMDGCSNYNSLEVRRNSRSKDQARAMFAKHDVPHASGQIFVNPFTAQKFAKEHGFPLCIKPNVSGFSRGSHFPITNNKELWKAALMVKVWWPSSVIEQYLHGSNYRVLATQDQIVSIIRRYPPFVDGNGKDTIGDLIDSENAVRQQMDLHPTIYPIKKSKAVGDYLAKQDLSFDSVPAKDARIHLFNRIALAPGGIVETIDQDKVPEINKALFCNVVKQFDASLFGIDVILEQGIEHDYTTQRCIFLEVNSRPYTRMHEKPRYGTVDNLQPFYDKMDSLAVTDTNHVLILLDNQRQSLLFYQFLGSHSLLIGLLPFYLPVFLWGLGFNLIHITLLIGVSGLSFCAALSAWQHLSGSVSLRTLMCITFALECALVAVTFFASTATLAIIVLGIANGLYNGFFWTTQRTLFLQLLGQNDTGKRYGNFQIFVTIFLKIGILIGGWLLDAGGLPWLLGLSAIVGGVSSWWFYRQAQAEPLHQTPRVGLVEALKYQDGHRSRTVFIGDGFFLFLESHYWTLSLFMLANENFARFGIIVVVLALLFALMFYLIKNTIDTLAVSQVFRAAVFLYALSWFLRCFVSDDLSSSTLLLLLLVITFCSSFFRLAFNKRFFDIAQSNNGISYLIIKSYQSQFFLGCGFIATAILLMISGNTGANALTLLYATGALGSFVYLLYQLNPESRQQPN